MECVASTPVTTSRATDKFSITKARTTESTVLFTGASQSSKFTVFLYSRTYPVDFRVAANCFMNRINANNLNEVIKLVSTQITKQSTYFVEFESGILSNPI